MRTLITILSFLLLAACSESDLHREQSCKVDLRGLSETQIKALEEFCRPSPREVDEDPKVHDELIDSASALKMSPSALLNTPMGGLIVQRGYVEAYGPIAMAMFIGVCIWLLVGFIIGQLFRTPVKAEVRPVLFGLWHRRVVVEWKVSDVDGWQIFCIAGISVVASGLILFGALP
jgi:hypothetical protein